VFSIASLFECEDSNPWNQLARRCEYSGVQTHQIPHFSWQTADEYQLESTQAALAQICETIPPFQFSTSGLGIFAGERKILFLIIVKTKLLLEIHETIWNQVSKYAINAKSYYSPNRWIPHITINLNPLSDAEFNCSLADLENDTFDFEFEVKKFGLIYLNKDKSGVDSIYPLKGVN
jgi:2'-5' RNA ligase